MSEKHVNGSDVNGHTPKRGGKQYPLMEGEAEGLTAASGRALDGVTLEALAAGEVAAEDLQVSAETLRAQAEVAAQAGYGELAENLQRAAELTAVPNEELLQMYELMRPGRSTYDELTQMAKRLEGEYGAPITAGFVREAADVYRQRKLLKRS